MQHRVKVFGQYYSVGAHQEGRIEWYAVAEYRGELLTVKGRSERAAIDRWQETAQAKHGNPCDR